jgi:hypothetical protein
MKLKRICVICENLRETLSPADFADKADYYLIMKPSIFTDNYF